MVKGAQTTVQARLNALAQQVIGELLEAVATPLEKAIAGAVENRPRNRSRRRRDAGARPAPGLSEVEDRCDSGR